MKFRDPPLFLILLFIAGSAFGQGTNAYPRGTYVCTTADGRHLTSDRPIRECLNREQRILGRSGVTLAVIQPTTSQQSQPSQNIQQQQQEEQRRLTLQARRLYATYPTQSSHQAIYQQQISPLTNKLQAAQEEMSELLLQQQKIQQEILAIAAPQSIPNDLQQRQEFAQRNIIIQQRILDDLNIQITNINDQFTKERTLLAPFWNKETNATSP